MLNEEKNWWEWIVDLIVDSLGYLVTRLALIASPIPVIVVLLESMNYAWYAWPLVISIEIIGYALGDKIFEGIRLQVLSIRQSIIPISIYTIVVEALMVGYRVLPAWVNPKGTIAEAIIATAAIFYPLMTLFGAFLYAFHLYLQQVKRQQKIQRENERQQAEQAQLIAQRVNEEKANREIEKAKLELEMLRQRELQKLELERIAAESKIRMRESQGNPIVHQRSPFTERSPAFTERSPAFNTGDKDTIVHQIVQPEVNDESQLDAVSTFILNAYKAGPLPSYRELAELNKVSKTTIANKIKDLRERGLMNGVHHE